MGEGIGKVIMFFVITTVICFVLSGIFGIILIFNNTKSIESKTKIQPDYRLEANGKRVDTVWVYKFKSE